jgi:FkbM family methyltransferase
MTVSAYGRALVARMTYNWVYARRLPASVGAGRIYVTPAAGLKYLLKPMPQIDPTLLRQAVEFVRPDDVVWDIGSNVGLFTFAAAARAGPNGAVFAFEPDAFLVQLLRRSARAQPATSAPVTIAPVAVASNISLRRFVVAPRSRALNAMAGYGYVQSRTKLKRIMVPAMNLDWLAGQLRKPEVIKCDVEGAEAEVFSGQSKMLTEIRPVIICEVSQASSAQVSDIFVKAHYHLYDGEKPLTPQSEIQTASWSTIAIPRERRHQYMR